MRSVSFKPYVLMVIAVLGILTLPYKVVQVGRSSTVSVAGFVGHWMGNLYELSVSPISYLRYWVSSTPYERELQLSFQLRETELSLAHALRENSYLREVLEQTEIMGAESEEANGSLGLMVSARVVFRALNSWENSFWIDVGEVTNERVGQTVIQLNSPVLVGEGLVGVVDYVGRRQSKVVLITDPSLSVSVRVVRGESYLAKGEVHGADETGWRGFAGELKGEGFNCETADAYGPSRDLRSGLVEGSQERVPIVMEGDLLVTSGMDGVFPSGIQVARVSAVDRLKEGGYAFNLRARPIADRLSVLNAVFVIPPLQFDQSDIPSSLW